ncbi:hypothetical protein GGTG_04451 [Gaeumannomyces tritici R3-111a-1]|uniref:Uncharacterized protein n=1 Tax=Gaeumannomyces tritici (strain R3-111a-1) TaxID=644352 RepID=J3NT53_GAET3|nr:hypothetical protein GGTG_04451 [Gaeumannomyces tritici R3-111a-1]EJT79367.1 hypothetical protein GGTG_04451 [Gaeumannomyces tritici R3-111a-1]
MRVGRGYEMAVLGRTNFGRVGDKPLGVMNRSKAAPGGGIWDPWHEGAGSPRPPDQSLAVKRGRQTHAYGARELKRELSPAALLECRQTGRLFGFSQGQRRSH